MNLLRICLPGNKWVQIMPAFGSSIVKQRILFMNRWKPTRNASFRLVAAVLAALLIFGGTAYAVRKTAKEQSPFDGCWTMDWIRETNSLIENVPSLAGNMFYGNDMMFNFSWFGRYNGVNMRFNFSGEPQYYRNGKIYDYRGKEMNLKLTDSNTFQKRWSPDFRLSCFCMLKERIIVFSFQSSVFRFQFCYHTERRFRYALLLGIGIHIR